MLSIKGILKLSPGVRMRRYLPNTVITTIVPCFTDTNELKIPMRIATKIIIPTNDPNDSGMALVY
jgi:hypothetical protein